MNIFSRIWKQFIGLKILKFFDASPDPNPGYFYPEIRDGKNQIRDKHPGSVILDLSGTQCNQI